MCWRTWVLWGRDWRILVFPVTCILGGLGAYTESLARDVAGLTIGWTIVSGSGMTHALATSPKGAQLYSGAITLWFGFFGVLTCIANLYSVGMISYKAW